MDFQTPSVLQFFLQLSGQPSSPVHVLRCPSDISFDEFLERAREMAAPFFVLQSTKKKAGSPVYGVVTNIKFQANGLVHNVADEEGFSRACATITRREYDRLRGNQWEPLLLTFEIVYPQVFKIAKPGLWARLKNWLGVKTQNRVTEAQHRVAEEQDRVAEEQDRFVEEVCTIEPIHSRSSKSVLTQESSNTAPLIFPRNAAGLFFVEWANEWWNFRG